MRTGRQTSLSSLGSQLSGTGNSMIFSFGATGKANVGVNYRLQGDTNIRSLSDTSWSDQLQIRQSDIAYMSFGDDFFRTLWTIPGQRDVVIRIPKGKR